MSDDNGTRPPSANQGGEAASSSNQENDNDDNDNSNNFSFKYTESGGLTSRYLLNAEP
jgi:hypothetical protein